MLTLENGEAQTTASKAPTRKKATQNVWKSEVGHLGSQAWRTKGEAGGQGGEVWWWVDNGDDEAAPPCLPALPGPWWVQPHSCPCLLSRILADLRALSELGSEDALRGAGLDVYVLMAQLNSLSAEVTYLIQQMDQIQDPAARCVVDYLESQVCSWCRGQAG